MNSKKVLISVSFLNTQKISSTYRAYNFGLHGIFSNARLSTSAMKKFANVENDIRFREKLFAGFPATDHVIYLPEIDELKDKDDQLVEIDDVPGFKDFFNKIPIRNITKGSVEHIEVEKFEEMSNKIKELQMELENASK